MGVEHLKVVQVFMTAKEHAAAKKAAKATRRSLRQYMAVVAVEKAESLGFAVEE